MAHRAPEPIPTPERSKPMFWSKYGKTIFAALVLVVTAVQAALSDSATAGQISQVEGVQIAIASTNAAMIYLVPNVPQWPYAKLIVAAGLAVLQLLATLIIDGVSSADLSALLLAGLLVLSGTMPSRSTVDATTPAPTLRNDIL